MADQVPAILKQIRDAAHKKILYLPHALSQMNAPGRMITASEVRSTILEGEVIEDYPEDVRGHSCLLMGTGENKRPVHVVCTPKEDYLAIITAYLPDPEKWAPDWKRRK
jgi:hypothetical protein